jgi:hypothetical protein
MPLIDPSPIKPSSSHKITCHGSLEAGFFYVVIRRPCIGQMQMIFPFVKTFP